MNNNINCSVEQCKHHSGQNNCSLSCVTIGSHGLSAKDEKCTDCQSFERK